MAQFPDIDFSNPNPQVKYSLGNIGGGKDFGSEALTEPWQQWANNNLPNLLSRSQGTTLDLASIFGPSYDSWMNKPRDDGTAYDLFDERPSLEGLDVNLDSLNKLFTAVSLPQMGWDGKTVANDYAVRNAQYFPHINESGMVQYNVPEKPKSGFLDKLSDYIVPLSMAAVGAAAGAGLGTAGTAAGSAGAGATGFPSMAGMLPGGGFAPISESALLGGFGGEVAGAAGIGAGLMPAAVPELAAANAVPGGVTAFSGIDNAVTAGLAGTSGFSSPGLSFGLPTGSELGINPGGVDMTGFSQPFNLESIFDFPASPVGGYGNLSGYYPGDFTSSMLPGGSMSPFGSAGGGMVDLSGGGMGSVTGTGTQGSFFENLMARFGNQRDPLKLVGSIAQNAINKKNNKKMQDAIAQSRQAGFPFQNYQYLAQMWSDPAVRYEMLKSNPAFQESQRYAQQVQARRNARTGDINSGFGAATIADTLGRNASAWDKQLFDQISKISGMDFNGNATTSQLAAALYPQIGKNNMNTAGSIFDAIRSNQGFFPDMLKTFFA